MIYYLSSLVISLFTLIMTIILMFVDSESSFGKFYNEKEIWVCIIISVILIALGLISDKRDN